MRIKKILMICLLVGNGYADLASDEQLFTVKKSVSSKPVYFSGIIKPITTVDITAPVDGVITDKHFVDGEDVTKGQALFALESESAQKKYQDSLSKYLLAKEGFDLAKTEHLDQKTLFDLGLIPRSDFQRAESKLNHANMQLLQETYALSALMQNSGIQNTEDFLDNIDIGNLAAVENVLKKNSSCIGVTASKDGIALTAPKEGDNYVKVGSYVKKGKLLLSIGDFSGIRLEVLVTELDVRDIKAGQKAIITGHAFPELILTGVVKHVDPQAQSNIYSGVPLFPVVVEVPNLTEYDHKFIKVGMSAQIKLEITLQDLLEIPINAVQQRGNEAIVEKYLNGEKVQVIIKTGRTTMSSVQVLDGLVEGDQIVIPN